VSFSLKDLQTTHDVIVRWHAYELRPAGSPPIPPAYMAKIDQARPRFNQMMRDEHGLDVQPGPFGIVSHEALVATKWAEAQDEAAGARFHEAVFTAYWLESEDISTLPALRRCAEIAGLSADALEAALTNPAQRAPLEAKVRADIEQASAYQLSGVPALIFEERFLVPGAVPAATLRQIVDQIAEESGSAR
jgi:predicted DsbA family dithiol-disulfide isomerase